MNLKSVLVGLAALASFGTALAQDVQPPGVLPEPESLALIVLAGVVGYVVSRKRKNRDK